MIEDYISKAEELIRLSDLTSLDIRQNKCLFYSDDGIFLLGILQKYDLSTDTWTIRAAITPSNNNLVRGSRLDALSSFFFTNQYELNNMFSRLINKKGHHSRPSGNMIDLGDNRSLWFVGTESNYFTNSYSSGECSVELRQEEIGKINLVLPIAYGTLKYFFDNFPSVDDIPAFFKDAQSVQSIESQLAKSLKDEDITASAKNGFVLYNSQRYKSLSESERMNTQILMTESKDMLN